MRRTIQTSKNNQFFILLVLTVSLLSVMFIFIEPVVSQEKQLLVTVDKYTVQPKEPITVTVKDEDGAFVSGATVGIQNVGGRTETTNINGVAWLTAPTDRSEITIIAQKTGYKEGKTNVKIYAPPGLIDTLIRNQYLPVVIAIIAVISAILLVNFRQKRRNKTIVRETAKEQPTKDCSLHGVVVSVSSSEKKPEQLVNRGVTTEEIHVNSKSGPKIEEIRISRPRKDKEVVSVKTEEDVEKTSVRKARRKHEYDWFEGEGDIRYKIDKITGEIDEDGVDKWFEGIDDIRSKIDEKIKKKDKKKN